MRRGDIVLADLEPVRGPESNKRRPVVVVSNDGANEAATRLERGVVTVVPVTSNVRHVYAFQVHLDPHFTGLDVPSKAQAEQVRSIAYERLGRRIGSLPVDLMMEVDEALRLHLAL